MPLATDEAIPAVKFRTTLPPPGIVKMPQFGTASPTVGFVVEGLVAPPFKLTAPVELKVKPVGRVSEIFTFMADPLPAALATVIAYVAVVPVGVLVTVAVLVLFVVVSAGIHCPPELAPGTSVEAIDKTAPFEPDVAPYASLAVVVMPFVPPVTLVPAEPLMAMNPPPPPPPGP